MFRFIFIFVKHLDKMENKPNWNQIGTHLTSLSAKSESRGVTN